MWIAQDENRGTLRTSRRSAGIIIAAAVLAELISENAITVTATGIQVHDPAPVLTPAWAVNLCGTRGPYAIVTRGWTGLTTDPLSAQICDQIADDPDLSTADVLEGLAGDIRERVAERVIATGQARRIRRWRNPLRRETVAVAWEHDLRPASATVGPLVKIQTRRPLTGQEQLVMHLISASSLGDVVLGHLRETTLHAALGPIDTVDPNYHDLLTVAIALVRGLALTH